MTRVFVAASASLLLATAVPIGLDAQPAAPAAQTSWPFDPPPDPFSPDALLDLRPLNEKVAGESGFIRVGSDGGFVRGDGRPIRFWAVNTEVGRRPFVRTPLGPSTAPDLKRHARFLAKRGVNMVRLHRQISPDLAAQPRAAITDINAQERDGIWRTVAAMRAEGIYTTLSPYWAANMKFAPAWGVRGSAAQPAWGLLFFDAQLQAAYKAWLRELLLPPSPYTGLPLANDASVAIFQIQNEDSLLFWTLDAIKGAQREALETRFADFLRSAHGTLEQGLARWGGERIGDAGLAAGRVALLPMWELTRPPAAAARGRTVRLADQTEFLARTMFEFNREIVRYLRHDLGVKALVNAGNWKTASSALLNDAERWTYTPGEVDAVNAYTTGEHKGPHAGWAIVAGDTFTNASVLRNPALLPLALRQTAGRPMLVTEGNWVPPNAYSAEAPFLVAAYASLLGVDGYYWFTTGAEGYAAPASANGYLPSQAKWTFATPDLLGGFPAAALAYRMGYIAQGTPVLHERRPLADLWARREPLLAEGAHFDPNPDAPAQPRRATAPGAAAARPDASMFLTGPVHVSFASNSAPPATAPSRRHEGGPIRANTGQVNLDPTRGVCTIDTPYVQGVAGHFGSAGSVHALGDMRIEIGNAYGAVIAVSMDGVPLAASRRVLLQVTTQSRPDGWRESPLAATQHGGSTSTWMRIDAHGASPWRVHTPQVRVRLANPKLTRATLLDPNGAPTARFTLERHDSGVEFDLNKRAIHAVLE